MDTDDYLDFDDLNESDFMSTYYDDNDIEISRCDDSFTDEVMDEYHHTNNHSTFCGRDTLPPNANSDGYIPKGYKELTSTISKYHNTFKLYYKGGHDYVLYNGKYYQIDGIGTVVIGGIKYNKI